MRKRYTNKTFFSFAAALMLMIFCVSKVLRGVDTSIGLQGGIWNYISVIFYFIALVLMFACAKKPIKRIFIYFFIYSCISIIVSLWYMDVFSIMNLYNLICIPYFGIIMYIFYTTYSDTKSMTIIFKLTYYIVLIVHGAAVIQYRIGVSARPFASDIYYALGLFPFMLLFGKNKFEKYINFAILFVITFLSGKRTGVLAVFCAMIVYLAIEHWHKSKKKYMVVLQLSGFVILSVAAIIFIDYRYNLGLITRLLNVVNDGGSGRSEIWQSIWEGFKLDGIMQQLFGHGLYATESVAGMMAHNDFLEILFDYGVIALLFFILFYFSLIKQEIRMIKRNSKCCAAMGAAIVIGIYLSMFSFFCIYSTYTTALMAFWGVALAINEEEEKNEVRCKYSYNS